MEDGPPSALGASDRLALLKRRQEAWNRLDWSSREEITMPQDMKWQLYGGVLAQLRTLNSIVFMQLPSEFRGIERKEWTVNDADFKIEDFKMDPSEDLLVMIQSPPT